MGSLIRQASRRLIIGYGRGGNNCVQNIRIGSKNCQNRSYSYDGDGKTTVTILNDEIDSPLMIDAYHERGFRLNNGLSALGPIALFPRTIFSWDVGSVTDITPESLALFVVLAPKLDILVIGIGDAGNQLDSSVLKFLRSKKIGFEVLDTEHACETFNFLSVEKRCVAAALIPPVKVKFYDDDVIATKRRRKQLFMEQYDELPL